MVHCRCWVLKNGVCNYPALEKINGVLILQIRASSPPELESLSFLYLKKYLINGGGGGGGGARAPKGPLGHAPAHPDNK